MSAPIYQLRRTNGTESTELSPDQSVNFASKKIEPPVGILLVLSKGGVNENAHLHMPSATRHVMQTQLLGELGSCGAELRKKRGRGDVEEVALGLGEGGGRNENDMR